jgi:hypothetical protein
MEQLLQMRVSMRGVANVAPDQPGLKFDALAIGRRS